MGKPSAKVVAHSRSPSGEELITIEIELHRFILPEFNTHRVFSRNFQSSRAVPVKKMIEQVRTSPAMPVHWGKNQRGMQADEENSELVVVEDFVHLYETIYEQHNLEMTSEDAWLFAAKQAADIAEAMSEAGYHKQVVNRLLEPFMWTKGVVTATREAFDGFFKLRCHKDAQPEIKLLAERMRDAINNSHPSKLNYGEYHLPYVEVYKPLGSGKQRCLVGNGSGEQLSLEDAIKVSTSCCAQVSYRNLDTSLDKARKIYDMLNLPVNGVYPEDPPHFSAAEHVAKVVRVEDVYDFTASGNFHEITWWQYRKALESGMEEEFLD